MGGLGRVSCVHFESSMEKTARLFAGVLTPFDHCSQLVENVRRLVCLTRTGPNPKLTRCVQ